MMLVIEMIKIKVFDEGHEADLEEAINKWLALLNGDVIDIKFNSSVTSVSGEQIYCFSALVIYHEKNPN